MHSLQKRLLAAVLSLVSIPGVGHYHLGAPRRAAYWVGAYLASFTAFVAAATFGGPGVFALGLGLAVAVPLAAAIDVLKKRAGLSPPWVRTLVFAVAALCCVTWLRSLVRKYCVESFRMPGNAMYPSLMAGDRLLASKIKVAPRRGEVLIYRNSDGTAFMKRVMALEWDRIEVRDNVVWVNGQQLQQQPHSAKCIVETQCLIVTETNSGRSYPIALSLKTSTLNPKPEIRVPIGHMFMMGDGRRWSFDSRMTGPIPVQSMIGTAKFVWWPPSRFGVLP